MIVLLLYLSRCWDSLVFRSSWLHRLCISLLTSCDAKILLLTTAALHFCPPAVGLFFWVFFLFQYAVDSCTLGKYKTGPEFCDKFLWPVVAVSFKKDFLFHMTPNLFVAFFCSDVFLRIERVSASFYQMVCIYKRTVCFCFFFLSMQHTTWLFWFIWQSWV